MSPTIEHKFSIKASDGVGDWLKKHNIVLAATSYQGDKAFFISPQTTRGVSVSECYIEQPMGMGVADDSNSFVIASRSQIYRFDDIVVGGSITKESKSIFAPHQSWITGELGVHDIVFNGPKPTFVNTLFNCISTVADGYNFQSLWKPRFISEYVAEDRCHLNGLATRNGEPLYVSCMAESDTNEGWRKDCLDGGLIIDVKSNEYVATGLSMPYSPRLYKDKLWVLNSGQAEIGYVDLDTGKFECVERCPGFARGLCFVDDYAVIGLSKIRTDYFSVSLSMQERLTSTGNKAICGLIIVDLNSGNTVEQISIEGTITELFDISCLPSISHTKAIGPLAEEINQTYSFDVANWK